MRPEEHQKFSYRAPPLSPRLGTLALSEQDKPQSVRSHLQSRVGMSDQEFDVVLMAARAAEKDIAKLVVEARARTANR